MARTGRPRPRRKPGRAVPDVPDAAPLVGAGDVAPSGVDAAGDTAEGAHGRAGGAARVVRPGVRLGVDVGAVRVGLAASDPDGLLATAVETLARDLPSRSIRRGGPGDDGRWSAGSDEEVDLPADVARLAREVAERGAVEVVVGLPRSLSGEEGRAAGAARRYAGRLADVVAPVPVRLVDERLSSAGAHRALHEGGTAGRRHRAVVDQVAAAWILQTALDLERSSGRPPGALVRPLGPDGRRRRSPEGPGSQPAGAPEVRERGRPAHDQHARDQDDQQDQHGHQDDEVGSRRGAGRADEDAVRAEGPPPEEDATVSTTRQPAPRPGPRTVGDSPAVRRPATGRGRRS